MTSENVYSAPQSDVTQVIDITNEIDIFPRMSAWFVFLLMLPTLGLYYYYWLYSRTKLVNTLPNRTLSMIPATIMLVLATISLIVSILNNIYPEVLTILAISAVISLVNLVFALITLFSLRTQLHQILQSSGATDTTLNHVMTFFFSSIYMQYKINKCIDERNQK